MWRWVNIKVVIAAFCIEAVIVILESIYIIHCHLTSTECWPWFFGMIANFPISIGVFQFIGFVDDSLHLESFGTQVLLMAVSFQVFGTLWWATLLHILVFVERLRRKCLSR